MLRDYINLIKMKKNVTAIHFSSCEKVITLQMKNTRALRKTVGLNSTAAFLTSAVHGADPAVATAAGSEPWTVHGKNGTTNYFGHYEIIIYDSKL